MSSVLGRQGVLVTAAFVLVAACSGGGADAGGEVRAELEVCRDAFGDENVASVESILADGGLQVESGSPDRLRLRLSEQARDWTAAGDDLRRDSSELCTLGVTGADSRGWMTGRVMWSTLTMDSVAVGNSAKSWHEDGDGVYVQRLRQQSGLAVVSPCRLAGTANGQERRLPLEISVTEQGLGGGDPGLTGRVASRLLTYVRELLGCQNTMEVPGTLTA
ncbi:hypothetical protein [Streptomyces showdoensis]|uniref:hypothetical protein n=1 Tax=Streptomyces showdoensis TaxID=68268 RepID=UPI00103F89DE|nr:hypothetical protein [Streptomyces showdoensis]